MAKDQIMAKGLRFFDKLPSQPDFVLGTIVVTAADINTMFAECNEYLTEYHGARQLRLQLLKSKEGKMYATVDTYKKEGSQKAATPSSNQGPVAGDTYEELPF